MPRLAIDTRHDLKWIKRRLAELHKFGWITHAWKGRGHCKGKVNIYTLHWAQIGPDEFEAHRARFVQTHRAQNGPETCIHRPEPNPSASSNGFHDEESPFH